MAKIGWWQVILGLLIGGGLLAGVAFAIGINRYGGVEGLVRRVRVSLPDLEPHPDAAPTIRPRATVDPAIIARILTPTADPLPTLFPSATPTTPSRRDPPLPTPTPSTPSSTPEVDLPPVVRLSGYTHHWQDWNNCGPATTATYLSFWEPGPGQAAAAAFLKPNPDDKNVNPDEITAFARTRGLAGLTLINSSATELKRFVSAGLPVMIETWLEPESNDGMGHYRLVIGYDEREAHWIVSDSYISEGVDTPYQGIKISFQEIEKMWPVFFRRSILIFPPEKEMLVRSILGKRVDERDMWTAALADLQAEISEEPEDAFLWHNLGRTLLALGEISEAAAAFDQARSLGLPWRMFWYQFSIFEAYAETGRYEDMLALTKATISSGGGGEELYYWQGIALAGLGDEGGAAAAWRYALWWHPDYGPALEKLREVGG